jgi:hypothetical protein
MNILKVGDRFKVPHVTLGHDRHKAPDVFTVLQVVTCPKYNRTSYRVLSSGAGEWWPHTRAVKVF